MTNRFLTLLLLPCLFLFGKAESAPNPLPDVIRCQGRLTNANGVLQGVVDLRLQVFDAAEGGALLYEDRADVQTYDGIYSTYLGDNSVLGSLSDALETGTVFLGVMANDDVVGQRQQLLMEMNPRAEKQVDQSGAGRCNSVPEDASSVAGGVNNVAEGSGATVAGGWNNQALDLGATVGGGQDNIAGGFASTISGGFNNRTPGNQSTIAGGMDNVAKGDLSFVTGRRGNALHDGVVMLTDGQDQDLVSTADDQLLIRAGGGVHVFGTDPSRASVQLAPDSGSWSMLASPDSREAHRGVNGKAVLQRMSTLPVTTWRYDGENPVVRHIGPDAADFQKAFGMGNSETHISAVDADGISFAAIQALIQELNALKAENQRIHKRLNALEAR